MAAHRGELTEQGLVQAIKDIYDFFYEKTNGGRYTKTLLADAYKVFEPVASCEKLAIMGERIVVE